MKFLILSSSRTGSTYLAMTIYSLLPDPSLLLAEPFQKPIIDYTLIQQIKQQKNVVLKTHLNQLYRLPKEHIDYFLSKKFKIILLLRKNLFNCTFSASVANAIDNYNDKKYNSVQLNIDIDYFLKTLNRKIFFWEKFAELKQKNSYSKIVYFEDLSFNPLTDAALFLKKFNFAKNVEMPTRTPYNLIDVQNKNELIEIFYDRIKNYSHEYIINNNGIFELA